MRMRGSGVGSRRYKAEALGIVFLTLAASAGAVAFLLVFNS